MNNNKIITVSMIMAKKPCSSWTRKRVRAYIGKGKTLKEILKINDICAADKIWCVICFLPNKINKAFAIWCAEQCKTDVQEIKDYIKVIKRYYAGKATYKELKAANEAANWAAYWAANWAANNNMRQKQIKKLLSMV